MINKRMKFTERHRRNLSQALKKEYAEGTRISYWKGKKMPDEIRKKISNKMKGGNKTSFKKLHRPWNKGLKDVQVSWIKGRNLTDIHKKRLSDSRKGKYCGINHPRYGTTHTQEARDRIGKASKGRIPYIKGKKHTQDTKNKIKEARKKQIFPLKDSFIELKIQDFLTLLKIEFYTHKYMNIKNSYQCDILIPEQKGIPQKTIIECDGDFFHCNPKIYSPNYIRFPNSKDKITAKNIWERDEERTRQLIEKGFRVIRIWGSEIKSMELNEFKQKIR